jgi:hypothetical protein
MLLLLDEIKNTRDELFLYVIIDMHATMDTTLTIEKKFWTKNIFHNHFSYGKSYDLSEAKLCFSGLI